MRKLIQWGFLFFLFLFINTTIFAASQSPLTLLKNVSHRMIAALEKNKSQLHRSDAVVFGIVNRILVPHIAVNHMAASVVGRQQWQAASSAQRSAFIDQFKRMVISTYAAALSSYDNDKIKFYPLRVNYQTNNVVTIRSVIIRRSGQTIPVSYNLIKSGNTWKVYDFSIENISMAQSYRAQFANVLSRQGMPGLIQRLTQHNRAVQ